MMRFLFVIIAAALALPVAAQETPHARVKPGLVYLEAKGTAGKAGHPKLGIAGGIVSQGTGFFVGTDGFILTTRHFLDPLEDAEARQVTLTASIGGANSDDISVLVASELKRVDLLLLKANMPFDKPPPKPLALSSISKFDRNNPVALFTSGFHGTNFRQKEVEFNRPENGDFPYAWEINVKTNSGQSGSPVYDKNGRVLGIVKGTAREDDELTLMIPVDFAMPLIGHLEINRLNAQVEVLKAILGEMTRDDPPLHERLRGIEDNMVELSNRFTWSARTQPNGDLIVRYEKLISGGTQIDSVEVKVTPNVRKTGANGQFVSQGGPLRLGAGKTIVIEEKLANSDDRVGEFVVPRVQEKLELLVGADADIYSNDPFRDLDVIVIPAVNGSELVTKSLTVIPNYRWNNQ